MIDLLSSLSSKVLPAAAPVSVGVAAGVATTPAPGRFGQTLDAFLDQHDAAPEPSALPVPGAARQGMADDGKNLPADASDGGDEAATDAPTIWFPAIPTLPIPLPVAAAASDHAVEGLSDATPAPSPSVAASVATRDVLACAVAPDTETPIAQLVPFAPGPAPDVAAKRVAKQTAPTPGPTVNVVAPDLPQIEAVDLESPALPVPMAVPQLPTPVFDAGPQAVAKTIEHKVGVETDAPAVTPLANAVRDTAVPTISVSAVAQPAGHVFAAALAVAGSWRQRGLRDSPADPSGTTLVSTTPTTLDIRERAIVHAAADSGRAALDLTQDSGLQRMIDRIEVLRDTADAGDTRVRLVPDALGSIDVAVRQEGDRVHVRFTAEQEATRALIAEAQPRLTELAAARGVRIGETSVSADTAGSGGAAPQPRPAPFVPRSPTRAARETEPSTDHRLA